jgi:hypothetical protein
MFRDAEEWSEDRDAEEWSEDRDAEEWSKDHSGARANFASKRA